MLIKQPNGKYCYTNGNEIKENLTEEEYKCMRFDQFMNQLNEELKEENLSNISDLIKYHTLSDKQLHSMGYEKTYDEMIKYIPKEVIKKTYYGRDCTIYGHCPTCDENVENGMFKIDKECPKCKQVLIW